jgi:quaternary ammonium compound-resistance protein SugE
MSWIYLFIAGLFEIGWAIELKYTEGFTKLWPSVITIVTMILSFYLFGESRELIRLFFILLIIIGIVGLKIFSKVPVQ